MSLPRRSVAADIAKLIDDLGAGDSPAREAAVARLTVIGDRAVPRLSALAADESAPADQCAAALNVLGAIGGTRAARTALALVDARESAVALAAIGALARVVAGAGQQAADALDRLSGLVLDAGAPLARRLAALEALEGLPARQLRPIHEALARDPASRLVARVVRRQGGVLAPLDELVDDGLPDDVRLVSAIVRDDAASTRVTALRRAVEAVREKEGTCGPDERAAWTAVRGQLHQALAARGSRIALYDLRETLERAGGPLPVAFLAAAGAVGDARCLEPVAKAWVAAASGDRWWRDHLEDVFRTIVRREGLTRADPTLVRILGRWPAAGVLVAAAPRAGGRRRA